MSDAPDFTALARQYLDLWEDQLAAMASDSALAEQSARFFEVMARSSAAANPLATAQMAMLAQQFMTLAGLSAAGRPDHGNTTPPAAGPAGPTSAATASGDSVQQLAELASRLAAIEERLDRLEAGGDKPRRRAQPAAGRGGKKAAKSAPKRGRAKPAKR